jgi:hypothetical protein
MDLLPHIDLLRDDLCLRVEKLGKFGYLIERIK